MSFRIVVVALLLISCSQPHTQEEWATNEGMQEPGSPPRLHASRNAEAALLSHRQSGLVVRAVRCCGYGNPHVQVQLFPNEVWRDVIRTDSTGSDGVLVLTELAPGSYTGLARRLGFKKQVFRVNLTAGYVDTLELDLGRFGQ